MKTIKRSLYRLCLVFFLTSCAHEVNTGHLKEDEALTNIKVGMTTRMDVVKQLGSPSCESSFAPKTWYYVSSIQETRSILPTKLVDEHTVEIKFDQNDVVSSIKQYSLKDSKNIQVVQRTTPSEGEKLGFFEQIFSNLGRFNKDKGATGVQNTHAPLPSQNGYPGGR